MKHKAMHAAEYRSALEQIGLSQAAAAEFLGVAARTSRGWALDESPVHASAAVLLRYMLRHKLTPEDILFAKHIGETLRK